ncbi:MAG: glycoside hydrolase family 3 N-terminal domain-containing protein [Candidatus Dormibacteria bacterium]
MPSGPLGLISAGLAFGILSLPLSACAAGTGALPASEACAPDARVASWSIARLASQVVAIPVQEADVAAVRPEVAEGVGGLLLFGTAAPSNEGAQLAALDSSAPGNVAPLVMTDEEGGAVERMANLVGALPSARQMGATMSRAQIEQVARQLGAAMRAQGVTMDLAPVLDLDAGAGPNAQDPDGTRSFSPNAALATEDGLAFAEGLAAGGVIPVVKHFPGLGQATGNTDDGPARTEPYSALLRGGLVPFQAAISAGLPAVMVANASVPGLTSRPASLSQTVITSLLKRWLGFKGLVLTDSLTAKAISDLGVGVGQASVRALKAGADLVLFGEGDPATQLAAIRGAIGAAVESGGLPLRRLQDAASAVLRAKHLTGCGPGHAR